MPAQPLELLQRFQDRILVFVGVVALFYLWHAVFLEWGVERYVATWMHDRILVFAGIALLLAVLGHVRAALGAAFAYPIVTVVGEVLGSAAWDLQHTFFGEDHEPVHIGWWIAVALFAWVVIGGLWGEVRIARLARYEAQQRAAGTPVTQP